MRRWTALHVVSSSSIALGIATLVAAAVAARSHGVLVAHRSMDLHDLPIWIRTPERAVDVVAAEFVISAVLVVSGIAILRHLRWGARILEGLAWLAFAYLTIYSVVLVWTFVALLQEAERPLTAVAVTALVMFAGLHYLPIVVTTGILVVLIRTLRTWEPV